MNRKYSLDLEAIKEIGYKVQVNGEDYVGKISVGDTLDVQGILYAVVGLNEDGVMVKELGI